MIEWSMTSPSDNTLLVLPVRTSGWNAKGENRNGMRTWHWWIKVVVYMYATTFIWTTTLHNFQRRSPICCCFLVYSKLTRMRSWKQASKTFPSCEGPIIGNLQSTCMLDITLCSQTHLSLFWTPETQSFKCTPNQKHQDWIREVHSNTNHLQIYVLPHASNTAALLIALGSVFTHCINTTCMLHPRFTRQIAPERANTDPD